MERHSLDLDPGRAPAGAGGELTFIGTATVLFRVGTFTFLTDPNFLHAGEHAYLGAGLRSRRLTEPALELADLPPLDFILLSHHHGDHFDQRVERVINHDLPIITEPHSARVLRRRNFTNVLPLDTWETQLVRRGDESLTVTAMPGKHSPAALSPVVPPVMGSLVEVPRASGERPFRIYITGDTLVHDRLYEIPRRYPDIDLCLIHLGGTRIAGVLLTMDAGQGVQALKIVAPDAAIPIHFDDYGVFKSPLSDFRAAAERELPNVTMHYLDRGATYRFLT